MYAHDLKAFALNERINPSKKFQSEKIKNAIATKPYAYIFKYESIYDVELLTTLSQKGVRVRSSRRRFTTGGQSFSPGTLVVTRRNNEHINNLDSVIMQTANKLNRKLYTVSTGFVEKGKDFGSDALVYVKPPRVAVLFGEQTSSLSAGEVWYFFEQQLHYPVTLLGTDYFKNVSLKNYDVLIIPEGRYRLFDEALTDQISNWVADGGKLILIGSALNSFSGQKGFGLKRFATDDEKEAAERLEKDQTEKEGFIRYDEMERLQLSSFISGAIYKVTLDNSHPLGFGLGNYYYSLKTNELRFAFLEHGWNVGALKGKVKPVQGFAGFKANQALENSLVFGVEEKGSGEIIYMVDNPLFRSFWENGKMLFANAVFMVGQASTEE